MKKFLLLEWSWLQKSENRSKLYGTCRALGPISITLGLFTPNIVQTSLNILAIFLFGGFTVAKNNITKGQP